MWLQEDLRWLGQGCPTRLPRWLKTRLFRNTGPKWDRNPTETMCGASPSKTHLRACRAREIPLGHAEKILEDSRKSWLLLQRLLTLSPANTSTQLSPGFSHPVSVLRGPVEREMTLLCFQPAPAPLLWGCFLWVGFFCAWALPLQGFKPPCFRVEMILPALSWLLSTSKGAFQKLCT